MNSIVIVFFCLILLVGQQKIQAINCYACSSGTDGCGPSFGKTGAGVVPTTDSAAVGCIKDVYTSNTNAIARSAGASCTPGSNVGSGTTFNRYCCTTDLCNGSSIKKANFAFAMISITIVLYLLVN